MILLDCVYHVHKGDLFSGVGLFFQRVHVWGFLRLHIVAAAVNHIEILFRGFLGGFQRILRLKRFPGKEDFPCRGQVGKHLRPQEIKFPEVLSGKDSLTEHFFL